MAERRQHLPAALPNPAVPSTLRSHRYHAASLSVTAAGAEGSPGASQPSGRGWREIFQGSYRLVLDAEVLGSFVDPLVVKRTILGAVSGDVKDVPQSAVNVGFSPKQGVARIWTSVPANTSYRLISAQDGIRRQSRIPGVHIGGPKPNIDYRFTAATVADRNAAEADRHDRLVTGSPVHPQ